ncbi:hypothetical protein SAMN05216410_3474 [Sanguibacter gelidistatuariae]|uniref:ATP synthase protein I n=1 Tax=Sanguibacter gelidistatuariae TaxID=1814289 RepID=A0A1G6VLJ9_9MICO|nr:hypothetical protein [Sanguibacter gelidistatuariae]SDD54459.1 hypothetical protein SAMN05216410_3474 [Sanguibacter gelidistatuariae]
MSNHDSQPAPDSPDEPRPAAEAADAAAPAIPVVPPHVTKEIFASALRATLIMLVVLTVVGIGVGALVAGASGVWAALLGVGVTLIFSGTTIASMLYTADKGPNTTMALLLGGWIAKMLVLVIILAVLGQLDFYHHLIFAVIVMVGVVGSAALDMVSVIRGREPYVSPIVTSDDTPH